MTPDRNGSDRIGQTEKSRARQKDLCFDTSLALLRLINSQAMIYHYRIRLRDLEDEIVSATVPQLPRCIVYLFISAV